MAAVNVHARVIRFIIGTNIDIKLQAIFISY